MKHVFSSPDSAQTGLVQSLLDAAGIAYEVRNEAVSQAEAGMPFITELWVLRDKDHEEARSLIQSEGSASMKPE
jgi:Putative prokaryotic signal transducing protein